MADVPEVQPEGPAGSGLKKEVRTWGMACHLAALVAYVGIPFGHILGPLIIWLIKREEDPFIDDQGKEAINFQITMTIAGLIAAVLTLILIGIVLAIALVLFDLVMIIVAAVKANDGERYRYPICIRFLK